MTKENKSYSLESKKSHKTSSSNTKDANKISHKLPISHLPPSLRYIIQGNF